MQKGHRQNHAGNQRDGTEVSEHGMAHVEPQNASLRRWSKSDFALEFQAAARNEVIAWIGAQMTQRGLVRPLATSCFDVLRDNLRDFAFRSRRVASQVFDGVAIG